jgi:hypothetical protein
MASRFFSTLCCIGSLPAIGIDSPHLPTGFITIGSGYLAVGDPSGFSRQVDANKIRVVGQRQVALPEMVATLVTLIGTQRSQDQANYTALVLADVVANQTVILFSPDNDTEKQKV